MANFNFNLPEELLPGLKVEFNLLNSAGNTQFPTLKEYLQASALELLRQKCEQYSVGPYFVGTIFPKFNKDGTPYKIENSEECDQSNVDEILEVIHPDDSEDYEIMPQKDMIDGDTEDEVEEIEDIDDSEEFNSEISPPQ